MAGADGATACGCGAGAARGGNGAAHEGAASNAEGRGRMGVATGAGAACGAEAGGTTTGSGANSSMGAAAFSAGASTGTAAVLVLRLAPPRPRPPRLPRRRRLGLASPPASAAAGLAAPGAEGRVVPPAVSSVFPCDPLCAAAARSSACSGDDSDCSRLMVNPHQESPSGPIAAIKIKSDMSGTCDSSFQFGRVMGQAQRTQCTCHGRGSPTERYKTDRPVRDETEACAGFWSRIGVHALGQVFTSFGQVFTSFCKFLPCFYNFYPCFYTFLHVFWGCLFTYVLVA